MKNGVHSIEQLNKLYDSNCLTDWSHLFYFNDVLMDVATSSNKKENINSIKKFNESFSNFFNCVKDSSFCVTTEFVKSISGLISTYEIRLRNISYCLDYDKTKLLPRNLFFCVWNTFRFALIPKMDDIDESNEKKLKAFQLFVKRLLQNQLIISSKSSRCETSISIKKYSAKQILFKKRNFFFSLILGSLDSFNSIESAKEETIFMNSSFHL